MAERHSSTRQHTSAFVYGHCKLYLEAEVDAPTPKHKHAAPTCNSRQVLPLLGHLQRHHELLPLVLQLPYLVQPLLLLLVLDEQGGQLVLKGSELLLDLC